MACIRWPGMAREAAVLLPTVCATAQPLLCLPDGWMTAHLTGARLLHGAPDSCFNCVGSPGSLIPSEAPHNSTIQLYSSKAVHRSHRSWSTRSHRAISTQGDLALFMMPTQGAWHAWGHTQGMISCNVSSFRHASTITKPGVPKPRPEVEQAMSTHNGGHLGRLIRYTEDIHALHLLLQERSDQLRPVHLAAAAMQLEQLHRRERLRPYAMDVKCVISVIEQGAVTAAPKLAAVYLCNIMRGLTTASHAISPNSLQTLAASLLAQGGRQLTLCSDKQWKDLVWGFSMQGYSNPLFWQQLGGFASVQLPNWSAGRAASVFHNLTKMGVRTPALEQAALSSLIDKVEELQPAQLVDALHAASCWGQKVSDTADSNTTQEASAADPNVTQAVSNGAHSNATQDVSSASVGGGEGEDAQTGSSASRDELLERFAVALRLKGMQQAHAMDGKTMGRFAESLARLPGNYAQDVGKDLALAASNLRPASTHPFYLAKILAGCNSLGYSSEQLTTDVARLALPRLHDAHPQVRQSLLQLVLDSVPAAAQLPEVLELRKAIVKLGDVPVTMGR